MRTAASKLMGRGRVVVEGKTERMMMSFEWVTAGVGEQSSRSTCSMDHRWVLKWFLLRLGETGSEVF